MRFRTIEMDVVQQAVVQPESVPGWGSVPWGALTQLTENVETDETICFSDAGYVTEDNVLYPPYVTQALDLVRSLTLTSDALGGSYSIGALTLGNPDGVLDTLLESRVNDHMPVRIAQGDRIWDATRQIWIDPPRAALQPVFAGLGQNWQPGLASVSVTLLDPTYWLEGAIVAAVYGGSGGLDGDSNVAGRGVPRLRGQAA